ncbi:MAG: Hsp20/alpha crystallin family protein [Nitrosopumilus sp. B06]|nr:MAG: Hsp20/alpha crystallin family protein [Nitrosopumilus sp. D6]RNJ80080.1 MAG: Hsp20/alpha crystallin family protein [Nitrosopumilus sp. B06]
MTMFDSEFNRLFRRMSGMTDLLEEFDRNAQSDPCCYSCVITGPDRTPAVQEHGSEGSASGTREPVVDTIVGKKEVKLVAEMPGVEKTDIKIIVDNGTVDLSAEHDEKKYHARVPIEGKIDEDHVRATYKNGILQIVFKLEEKPAGKKVEVE